MKKQQTVQRRASVSGIALHSGVRCTVTVSPAEVDTGIVFRRVDLPGQPLIHALASNVADVRRGTAIAENNGVVFTVEHIMSALNACHIDNCIVDMDGMEPPILAASKASGSPRKFSISGFSNVICDSVQKSRRSPARYFRSG